MRLVYTLSISGLLWFGWLQALAQWVSPAPTTYTPTSNTLPKWVVKFAPLSLLDPSGTVQFALERTIGHQQSLQFEAGYGSQRTNIWQQPDNNHYTRYSQYEVWRGRAEWRYYWRRFQAPIGSYLALEGLYKQENAFENGTVGVGVNEQTGQYQYYQLYSLPLSKHVWAFTVKVGRQFPLPFNNRFVADFYGGLGIRHRTITRPDRPEGYLFYSSSGSLIDPFSTASSPYSFLNVSYGVKVGYTF
ncbi:hypothetical protein [Spirosoma aerolatum]|uniref:hypothetical protein n=1 Tax=Spirosoma aerolatum TaxID=1211326 RepID=UPI0009AE32F2|nr:hypothetical protein [Spirosoma aerolatum]